MDTNHNNIWKYSYWLDDSHLEQLKREMNDRGITVTGAQYSPCEVLRGEIGYAEPHVWPVLCKPDATPWYSESKYISTCCVELFNLLDSGEKAFLVRPCIGAVIAEGLEDNQYYLVKLIKN